MSNSLLKHIFFAFFQFLKYRKFFPIQLKIDILIVIDIFCCGELVTINIFQPSNGCHNAKMSTLYDFNENRYNVYLGVI